MINKNIGYMMFGKLCVYSKHSFTLNAPEGYETCVCDCGRVKIYKRADLLSGKSTWCGMCPPIIGIMPTDIYTD